MNIDKIIKECPKAWEEWIYYATPIKNGLEIQISTVRFTASKDIIIGGAFPDGYLFEYSIHFRELYDYFDSVGVKVSVYFDADDDWCYEVLPLNPELIVTERWYESRQDVEFEAIPKAFEIREQQL